MRALALLGLAWVPLATGCIETGQRLDGVTRDEAFAAAVLTLRDDEAELDPAQGTVVQRFGPGELPHRQGPQRVISVDVGSKVMIRARKAGVDAVTLEVNCTEERYTPPVPPVDSLRDPDWEDFLRQEIIMRLRWNRLRVTSPGETGAAGAWREILENAYAMLGLEVETAPAGSDTEPTRVQRARDGLVLAMLGRSEKDGVRWLLLAGPPRIGGDIALDSIITHARAAQFTPLPLTELPASP